MNHANFQGLTGGRVVTRPSSTGPGRYSEHRRSADIGVVLLFDAPFECVKREIVDDLLSEYSMLGVEEQVDLSRQLAVGSGWTTSIRSNAAGHRHVTQLSSGPGRYQADLGYALRHSYAFEGARSAASDHAAWLKIDTASESYETGARFRAATASTCIAAAFARLPNCLGVYLPGANLIVSPQRWCRDADEAVLGEFPIDAWVSLAINRTEREGPRQTLLSCSSIGLATFTGHEVHLPWSDLPPGEVARIVYMALWLQLVEGRRFQDGDVLGERGDENRIRIRHAMEGENGLQTDAWLLFDGSTVVDEKRLFGPDEVSRSVEIREEEVRRPRRLFGRRS